jgi:hypothetical protein
MTKSAVKQDRESPVAVAVDTNVIIQSPRLNSLAWRALFAAQVTGTVRLFVPEVCVIEACAWVERELPDRLQKLKKAERDLHQIIGTQHPNPWDQADTDAEKRAATESSAYESHLRRQLSGSEIVPIPDVDHRGLVVRAAYGTRPFKKGGDGYRDALIWENVCALAQSHGNVVFVTANTRDFADDNKIATVLLDDLRSRGIAKETVTLCTSVMQAVELLSPDSKDTRQVVETQLNDPQVRTILNEDLNMAFSEYEGIDYPAYPGELHVLFTRPVLDRVWEVRNIEVHSATATGDDAYIVSGALDGRGGIYQRIEYSDSAVAQAEAALASGAIVHLNTSDEDDFVIVTQADVNCDFVGVFRPPGDIDQAGVMDVRPVSS